jgi:hypothetical protein
LETTASEIFPQRNKDLTWDVMHASKVEVLRGPSGRLLQYDPSTDEVTVLRRGLYFANGVAVAEDESYLVYVETFFSRVTKYYLAGEKKGTTEFLIDGDPSPACEWIGLLLVYSTFDVVSSLSVSLSLSVARSLSGFDGIDCAWKRFGAQSSLYCYTIGVSTIIPAAKLIYKLPQSLQIVARTLLLMIPKQLVPKVMPYAGIMILDPETRSQVALIQDPRGTDVATLTGITFHENKLYLGSLHNDYIGVYSLM